MGVIGPLSRRVGVTGRIFGVDRDPLQLAGARQYVGEQSLGNVQIVEDNAYALALPGHSFDFVHARFLLAPVGDDDELLREMWRLAKPGAIIALQEPDASAWDFDPSDPDWRRLKACILAGFRSGGPSSRTVRNRTIFSQRPFEVRCRGNATNKPPGSTSTWI